METPRKGEKVSEPAPVAKHFGNGSSSTAVLESRSGQITRRATGPRTAAGKRRSRYNALKSGLFAKDLLLKHESRAEYQLLLTSLREHFQPQGMLEATLVENLVAIRWRKRRLFQAETAQIEEAIKFGKLDSVLEQAAEAWDQSRAGESSGGMLRHSANPVIIEQAIQMLTAFRASFEKYGFKKDEDPWILRKLYGLDHDNAAPISFFRNFQISSKIASGALKTAETHTADQLKREALECLDVEIERLEFLHKTMSAVDEQRGGYQTTAALIPSQRDLDVVIRYEAHLSREFDRTLSQLERCQKIRLGLPTPPTMRVEISRE
jgi:hypothetical protein